MPEYTLEQLHTIISSQPTALREYLLGDELQQDTVRASQGYSFTEEVRDEVENVILFLVLKLIPQDVAIATLQNICFLSLQDATHLYENIAAVVLVPKGIIPPPLPQTATAHSFDVPQEIIDYTKSQEFDATIRDLSTPHNLTVSQLLDIKTMVTEVLCGLQEPQGFITLLPKKLNLSTEASTALVHSIDDTIFSHARNITLGLPDTHKEVYTLTFGGENKEELRDQILSATAKDSAITTPQVTVPTPDIRPQILASGSRSDLLEQLHVLDTIPDDAEVEARLNHIREQVAKTEEPVSSSPTLTQDALYALRSGSNDAVVATEKPASYSKAPTEYNIDPYRELAE